MDKQKNCTACNIELDKDKDKKDRTTCKNRYKKKNREYKKFSVID